MPEFKVLGMTEIRRGRRNCTPPAAKVRQVLALLLLRGGQIVPIEMIVEELWVGNPPRSAVATAQTYVYQLRKFFSGNRIMAPDRHWLLTRPPGYQFLLQEGELDASVFESRVREASSLLETRRPREATSLLRQALAMWTGPAMLDLAKGPHLDAQVFRLEELRVWALELSVQAGFALGCQRELVGELRTLITRYPFNEWFHGRLIAALAGSGRRGEALQAYHDLRRLLNEELGLSPSEEIERLQSRILNELPVLGEN